MKKGKPGEGKSPNKHNLFFIEVERLEDEVYEAIKKGEIVEKKIKKKDDELWKILMEDGF